MYLTNFFWNDMSSGSWVRLPSPSKQASIFFKIQKTAYSEIPKSVKT